MESSAVTDCLQQAQRASSLPMRQDWISRLFSAALSRSIKTVYPCVDFACFGNCIGSFHAGVFSVFRRCKGICGYHNYGAGSTARIYGFPYFNDGSSERNFQIIYNSVRSFSMALITKAIKGTQDVLPSQSHKNQFIESTMLGIAKDFI